MKSKKKLLAGPYLFWAVSFIIIPLFMILYYGLTNSEKEFTLMNLAKITTPENLKALGLALLLSLVSTIICLVHAFRSKNHRKRISKKQTDNSAD